MWWQLVLVYVCYVFAVSVVLGDDGDDGGWPLSPDDMLDTCIDSNLHKRKPGKEDSELYRQCSNWSERSCCTQSVSRSLHHNTTWYRFTWNHCPARPLSDRCRAHFIQDLCFYECEPNVGPWLVKVNRSWRKTRFMHVPLCAADCDQWFQDCRLDLTCRANWGRGFDWSTGQNVCPADSDCRTFDDIYQGNASLFCEAIWDYSFRYVAAGPASTPCMTLTPNNTSTNRLVAEQRVREIRQQMASGGCPSRHVAMYLMPVMAACMAALHYHRTRTTH